MIGLKGNVCTFCARIFWDSLVGSLARFLDHSPIHREGWKLGQVHIHNPGLQTFFGGTLHIRLYSGCIFNNHDPGSHNCHGCSMECALKSHITPSDRIFIQGVAEVVFAGCVLILEEIICHISVWDILDS